MCRLLDVLHSFGARAGVLQDEGVHSAEALQAVPGEKEGSKQREVIAIRGGVRASHYCASGVSG
jgi:hypothetical protein